MANLYFEFEQNVLDMKLFPSKYMVAIRDAKTGAPTHRFTEHSMNATRIWCEQDGHVWYVKNRYHPLPEVNMKEFMWVKLSSQAISA